MGMTADQAIELLFRQRNSVGCGDLSWQDAIDIGDLIQSQAEQLRQMRNCGNCANGTPMKCDCECALLSNWQFATAIGAEGRGGDE